MVPRTGAPTRLRRGTGTVQNEPRPRTENRRQTPIRGGGRTGGIQRTSEGAQLSLVCPRVTMDLPNVLARACLAATLSFGVAGCTKTGPVLDITNAPVYRGGSGTVTLEQVRDKIAAGVQAKRWGIEDESRGWMLCRVDAGGHWARVRITYDTTQYTIVHFESSPGLKWNGTRIHKRYNNWIKLLDQSIRKQLMAPPVAEAPAADAATPTEPGAESSPGALPEGPPVDGPEPDPSWNEPE
jgi:hypothetical protein